MYYIYALLSKINNDLYIGYTSDLKVRFKEHNEGKVKSTRGCKPWKLVYYEAYFSKKDAVKREKQLKMHKVKDDLKIQIENSLLKLMVQ
jgi:putative endonuclease